MAFDMRSSVAPSPAAAVRELLGGELRAVFQPIVDLNTGEAVGYEALARGPEGSPMESPAAMFTAARRMGILSELDLACRVVAVRTALDSGLHPERSLFINLDPGAAPVPATSGSEREVLERARRTLRIVLELTENSLDHDPAALLARTRWARGNGAAVALDDVGADPATAAFMPFVLPEVIKLDRQLIQFPGRSGHARVIAGVQAEAERTGALVVAEGVETETHRTTALALGASLAQGWFFGRPGPLPPEAALAPTRPGPRPAPRSPAVPRTPFELLAARRPVRVGTKRLLLQMSRALEQRAISEGPGAVILATFQESAFFTPTTRGRYRELARQAAFVGALGVGLEPEPEPGVRGAALWRAEALRGEWDVCCVGPHLAGAFAARDLGDTGPDLQRRFQYAITHDRALAAEAASSLMVRMSPRGADPR